MSVGYGARGLLYHAWAAEMLAEAIVVHDSDDNIPVEMRAWQKAPRGGSPDRNE